MLRRPMSGIAFLGGTGHEGQGLALRLAAAGEAVVIGSRVADRAVAVAERIRSELPAARVHGCTNAEALAGAERIVLTFPFAALPSFLDGAAERLAGKLVIDVIVPLALGDGIFALATVPGAASVGELIQRRAPGARVVSAFKNLSAEKLRDLRTTLAGDVVLCGEDPAARAEVADLVRRFPGLRPVDAGALANARYLEALTALIMNVNRRYRARASIRIIGLERTPR